MPGEKRPEDNGPREDVGFWKTGLGYVTQIGIILAAVAGIIGGVASLTGGGGSSDGASAGTFTPASKLQVVDLAVSGGVERQCINDPPGPQRLDLTVRNVGDQPAVVKRVGLRVRATGYLRIPQAGGGLEPSKNYDILLPANPRLGQLFIYKVSQEVKARGDDRFTLRLDEPQQARQGGDRLYQLDMLLYHDTATTPIDAGTAIVSTPFIPDKSFFWAGVLPVMRPSYKGSGPLMTMKENEKTLRRMLALPGERAPELTTDLVDVPLTSATPCLPSGRSPTAPQEPSSGTG
jgi:hypothetical protein